MESPLLTAETGSTRLEILVADITTLEVDAIVNAANTSLLGGGGVDGAIHRAGGPELRDGMQDARRLRDRLGEDHARLSAAGKDVIHAVGPVWHGGGSGEGDAARSCYSTAMRLRPTRRLRSIAFPAISTGVYGFPADRAARIAVGTVVSGARHGKSPDRARGVLLLRRRISGSPRQGVHGRAGVRLPGAPLVRCSRRTVSNRAVFGRPDRGTPLHAHRSTCRQTFGSTSRRTTSPDSADDAAG